MWYQKRQNKYNAKSSEYNGIMYHSMKEAGYAMELDLRVKAKEIKKWRRQEKISLDVNGYHIANYYIDFVITHNDGTEEFIEVKGFETEIFRLKWKLTEALLDDKIRTGEIILTLVK